jgi:omega-amidase
MKIYCCQLDITWEDRETNFEKVEALMARVPPTPGSLVIFPEMAFTGFSMNIMCTARGEPESSERFLVELSKRLGVYLLSGVVSASSSGRGKNEAVFVCPKRGVTHRYKKVHLFTPAQEHEHFEPGSDVVSFSCGGGTVVPAICYDLRFPELFRAGIGRGAELFAIIANWPAAREHHWRTLLQARAIENQAYVVGVNRCGSDPRHHYAGGSLVVAPDGTVCAEAGPNEQILSVELDWELVRDWRRRFPAILDVRRDLVLQ